MDWNAQMNEAIAYIEKHLREEIDGEKLARITCCTIWHFQRMFSAVAGIPLSEYIRRRRLTQAAMDLQEGGKRVTDVALDYGYASPAAFTRAFREQHGVTPTEARARGARLRAYPVLRLEITVRGDTGLVYRIEEKPEFHVAGIHERVSIRGGMNFARIPQFWNEACSDGRFEKIAALSGYRGMQYVVGMCTDITEEALEYWIAAETAAEPPEGMDGLTIPAGLWAIFECVGPIPEALQDVTRRIFSEWFPASEYQHADAPEIEWYSEGKMRERDYLSEVWIPVERVR